MKHLLYLSLAVLALGCGSSNSTAQAPNPAKQSLAAKLKTMTPDERREYMKTHPDEVRAALGMGVGPGPRTGSQ